MKNEVIERCVFKIVNVLKTYKYACLILAVGIVLMVLPEMEQQSKSEPLVQEDVQTLEARMEQLLQHVNGAGKVKVLLSEKTGPVSTYQENVSVFSREEESERKTETVLISTSDGETAIPLQTIYPTYQGAVVLAEGADRPSVKLNLVRAVSSLTGLGSDQITVIKMKTN